MRYLEPPRLEKGNLVNDIEQQRFAVNCPSRLLFEEISDKWSMMVLTVLVGERTRFNELKRRLEGISQKPLTQCLRKLERNGLVTRRVIQASPVGVEYAITPLGRSLHHPFKALYGWTVDYLPEVAKARHRFDAEQEVT